MNDTKKLRRSLPGTIARVLGGLGFCSSIFGLTLHGATATAAPPIISAVPYMAVDAASTPELGRAPPVVIMPGQSIQTAVDAHPDGTVFIINSGVHRGQTISPKNYQQFIGLPGAVLSGAMALENWQTSGSLWKHSGLPAPLEPKGYCEDGGELCKMREDLFVNDVLYQRVGSREEVGHGRWFFDPEQRTALISDDPTSANVELSVTPVCFDGSGVGVTIRNLTVEKYATPAQGGAIYGAAGAAWRIIDTVVRWNHGVGISLNAHGLVSGGASVDNGQDGIASFRSDGALIQGVEIARNNYARFHRAWQGGGLKMAGSDNMSVIGNYVHHNFGVGIWGDIDMVNSLIANNRVVENAGAGISYEISYGAVIRDNVALRNGDGRHWLWSSQILIQNSRDAAVHGNIVEVDADVGNGIGLIYQDRGLGKHGAYHTINNNIHSNIIIHLGTEGASGFVTDSNEGSNLETTNHWDNNLWIVPTEANVSWWFGGKQYDWRGLVENAVFEQGNRLMVEQRTPSVLAAPDLVGAVRWKAPLQP